MEKKKETCMKHTQGEKKTGNQRKSHKNKKLQSYVHTERNKKY
jgi:hypothetical protein